MTTFAVRGGGNVSVAFRQGSSSFACMGGGQVVEATVVSRVGNNSARGTSWLPPSRIPLGTATVNMPDGTKQTVDVMVDPQWYRAFDEAFNRRLGGVTAQSLPDVAVNATAAIVAASSATQQVASVAQDVSAVQDAAIASKDVLVAANVPGATQIPTVRQINAVAE